MSRPRDPMLREFQILEEIEIRGAEDAARVAEMICDLFTDDCILEDTTSTEVTRGRDGLRAYCIELLTALPDFRVVPTEIWEDGQTAVMALDVSGTHSGPMYGHEASGRRITWSAVAVYRCNEEMTKVHHETWAYDSGTIIRQIKGEEVATS
jgi:steroid delta-isomerase-like uncharacterized protein